MAVATVARPATPLVYPLSGMAFVSARPISANVPLGGKIRVVRRSGPTMQSIQAPAPAQNAARMIEK
jgi:hypothetical protein